MEDKEVIVPVNWGDYKYFLEKTETRRHTVSSVPHSYNEDEKTIDLVLDSSYFKKITIKYAEYKKFWEVDCFKEVDSYDEDEKTIDVWVDIEDMIYKRLNLKNIYFDDQAQVDPEIDKIVKDREVYQDLEFAEIVADQLAQRIDYFTSLSSLKLKFWQKNRIVQVDIIQPLREIHSIFDKNS